MKHVHYADDIFAVMIGYQMFAIASGRVPPITHICGGKWGRTVVVMAVVGIHLLLYRPPPSVEEYAFSG